MGSHTKTPHCTTARIHRPNMACINILGRTDGNIKLILIDGFTHSGINYVCLMIADTYFMLFLRKWFKEDSH